MCLCICMYAYTHVYVTIIKEEMDLRGSVRDTNGAGRKKGKTRYK